MTHSELAAQLLEDAADFFRAVANENPVLKEQMDENARVYEGVASLLRDDPMGVLKE